MALQSYTAYYQPGVYTTVLLVVHVNAHFFKEKTFPFLVELFLSKCGLSVLNELATTQPPCVSSVHTFLLA